MKTECLLYYRSTLRGCTVNRIGASAPLSYARCQALGCTSNSRAPLLSYSVWFIGDNNGSFAFLQALLSNGRRQWLAGGDPTQFYRLCLHLYQYSMQVLRSVVVRVCGVVTATPSSKRCNGWNPRYCHKSVFSLEGLNIVLFVSYDE